MLDRFPLERPATDSRRSLMVRATSAVVLANTFPLLGCRPAGQETSPSSTRRPRIVATTGMIADIARQIGGEAIDVVQLIQAGVDPHLYKPIRDDVVAILDSDLVFYNGLMLEGRMADLLQMADRPRRPTVPLSAAIPEAMWMGEPGSDAMDPHLWMDVSLWMLTTVAIERELTRLLPDDSIAIAQRADDVRRRLETLDRQGRAALATIPKSQRVLISSHDAFQYFGRRYGLQVEGVQGMSTASEAGLQRIPELIDLIASGSVPAVFKESSVAGKLIDAVVEGAGARGIVLRIGEELYSDALGPSGSGADNYEGMMRHNFRAVTQALGGTWDES